MGHIHMRAKWAIFVQLRLGKYVTLPPPPPTISTLIRYYGHGQRQRFENCAISYDIKNKKNLGPVIGEEG